MICLILVLAVTGWKIAAVLSAALFALIHLQGVNFLPIFILGLLFAGVYQITKSIWPAIILHAAVNGFSILLVYVFVQFGG